VVAVDGELEGSGGEIEGEADGEGVVVADGELEAGGESEADDEGEAGGEGEADGEREAEADGEAEGEGEAEDDGELESECDGEVEGQGAASPMSVITWSRKVVVGFSHTPAAVQHSAGLALVHWMEDWFESAGEVVLLKKYPLFPVLPAARQKASR
jgi:hypothetical protein